MYAVIYNGTIYISHVHVKEDRPASKGNKKQEPRLECQTGEEEIEKICYMGKQFEMVISEAEAQTQDTSSANGDECVTMDEKQGFYSVSDGTFGGRHRVLIRSEIDGIENVRTNTIKPAYKNLKFKSLSVRNFYFKHLSHTNHFSLKFQDILNVGFTV